MPYKNVLKCRLVLHVVCSPHTLRRIEQNPTQTKQPGLKTSSKVRGLNPQPRKNELETESHQNLGSTVRVMRSDFQPLFTLRSSSPATRIAPGSFSNLDYVKLPPWLLNQQISFVLEANIERKLPMGQVQFSKPSYKSWDSSGWLLLESL